MILARKVTLAGVALASITLACGILLNGAYVQYAGAVGNSPVFGLDLKEWGTMPDKISGSQPLGGAYTVTTQDQFWAGAAGARFMAKIYFNDSTRIPFNLTISLSVYSVTASSSVDCGVFDTTYFTHTTVGGEAAAYRILPAASGYNYFRIAINSASNWSVLVKFSVTLSVVNTLDSRAYGNDQIVAWPPMLILLLVGGISLPLAISLYMLAHRKKLAPAPANVEFVGTLKTAKVPKKSPAAERLTSEKAKLLEQLLQVSTRVKLNDLAGALEVPRAELLRKLAGLAGKFPFKIEEEVLVLGEGSAADFAKALDLAFDTWGKDGKA